MRRWGAARESRMSVGISFHNVVRVSAERLGTPNGETKWTTLTIFTKDYSDVDEKMTEIVLFGRDAEVVKIDMPAS